MRGRAGCGVERGVRTVAGLGLNRMRVRARVWMQVPAQVSPRPLPAVAAVYDVTLNFRGNKNPSLLGILYGKKYEADMCVR